MRKRKVLVGDQHAQYKLLSLTKNGVIVRDVSTGKGKFSSDMGTNQEVRNGDLVLCLFDVPETPRTVGISRHDGMITGAYTVMEFLNLEIARYLEMYYIAMDDRKLLSPLYSGLRNTIPPPRFLGTKSPLPPPDEQAAIVHFLDHVNRRIEKTIRAKKKIITLLNEQKQIIIHQAVTRGLDPNVRLKPSGVPWLGEIPEGWEVRRNGHLFKERIERGQRGLPVLAVSLRTGVTISSDVARGDWIVSDRNRLYWDDFKRLMSPVPSINEQKRIVEYVATQFVKTNRDISRAEHEIDLLREYRTRLIADVVTGKLDVRGAAARLPDEIEEPMVEAPDDDLDDSGEEVCHDN